MGRPYLVAQASRLCFMGGAGRTRLKGIHSLILPVKIGARVAPLASSPNLYPSSPRIR